MTQCPPVLILAFNRPHLTEQLVRALAPVAPPVVYAALDGPRDGVPEDEERCDEVRSLVCSLPWEHELRTLFRDTNLGCGPAVVGGIDWLFTHEGEGVILEDDILPHPSMFSFMAEILSRYRDDERVMHVSATNYGGVRGSSDYFFSRYVSIWGWGTWRRAWKRFNFDISDWRQGPDVLSQPGLGWRTRRYLAFSFDRAAAGLGNWDYQWKYAVMRNGLAITPSRNLAVTTGFGEEATHLRREAHVPPLEPMPAQLKHPPRIEAEASLDHRLFHEQLGRAPWYWEASRLVVSSPRLYHRIGRLLRGIARAARRSRAR